MASVIDFGKKPPVVKANGATSDVAPKETPTKEEPLRGLTALAKVATFGRTRLLGLAAETVEYVWQDIAVAGTIVLLSSGPSEGKTTLLFLILAARANQGTPVTLLDRIIVAAPPGKFIVIIEGEHSESSASRKLVRSLQMLGVNDSALGRIILIARKAVQLNSPEWRDIVRLVAAGLVSDIALDTIARVAPSDSNDEREQVAIFDIVAQAIDAAPTPADRPIAWAAAHTRKNGGRELADVSGSTQRTGQVDSVLMLEGVKVDGRTISTKVTFAKLREEPDEYPLPVSFSISAGAIETQRHAADKVPLETRITSLLQIEARTKNALAKAVKRSAADVDAALSNLFGAKTIRSTTVLIRGKEEKGFMLAPSRQQAEISPDFSPDSGGQ